MVEGRSFFDGTEFAAALSFENDSRIEFGNFGHLTDHKYNVVNKGTLALHDTSIAFNNTIENDDTISIVSHFSPDFSSIVVRGTGTISVEPNTSITFGTMSSQQTVLLMGDTAAHSTIKLILPFQAPITGLVAGDTILSSNFSGTSTTTERDTLVSTRPDLAFEGIGLNTTNPNGTDAVPVYRIFDNNNGTHFYIDNAAERGSVRTASPDLKPEDIGFYAPT